MNFVEGMQGNNPHYYRVIATPKHFAVHSGPRATATASTSSLTPHDLWDTYLPAFRATIVDAHADSIMCAYNAIEGQPACGSDLLMQTILRGYWNFQGFVTSDCGAVSDFWRPNAHHTSPDSAHAARRRLPPRHRHRVRQRLSRPHRRRPAGPHQRSRHRRLAPPSLPCAHPSRPI